jgi:hypothetical protein
MNLHQGQPWKFPGVLSESCRISPKILGVDAISTVGAFLQASLKSRTFLIRSIIGGQASNSPGEASASQRHQRLVRPIAVNGGKIQFSLTAIRLRRQPE